MSNSEEKKMPRRGRADNGDDSDSSGSFDSADHRAGEGTDDSARAGGHFGDESDTELGDDMYVECEGDVDDLGDESVDEVAAARERLSVATLLERLRTDATSLQLRDFFVLSDLSRGEVAQVEAGWPPVPTAVRRRVIEALTDASNEHLELQLGRLLRVAMQDVDPTVRRLAVDGLWEETEADLIGPLVALLAGDDDAAVRAAAAAALGAYVLAGELGEMDSVLTMRAEQALLAVLQTPGEPVRIQARALESLAFSSEAGLRQLIEEAYYAPEPEMRLGALRAMGRSADTRWRSMLRAELSSPDAQMRAEAARACGELDAKAATQDILGLLVDDEAEVRLAAIEALGHLGGKAARDTLRLIAAEGEESEAEAAEIALEEMQFYAEAGAVSLYPDEEEEDDRDDPDFPDDLFDEEESAGRPSLRKGRREP